MVVLVVDNDEHKALDSEQGLVDYHVTVGSRVDSERGWLSGHVAVGSCVEHG